MDFADDENLAAPSTRVSPILNQRNNDVAQAQEETIKILLNHIDDDSWKTEEMDNHLAEFDARSEELSKAKSIVEEQSEMSKTILTAFDNILVENERLQQSSHEKDHQNNNLRLMNTDLRTQLQQFDENIRENEHNIQVLRGQLEKAEVKANSFQFDVNKKNNEIKDLQDANRLNATEVNILCDQIKELKMTGIKQKDQLGNFTAMVQAVCKQNVPQKMLQRLKCSMQTAENDKTQHDTKISDDRSIVPYSGAIENWDYIMIPVLKNFFFNKL